MIKLKDLICEAGGPTNVWRTPDGTPDEVVEVLHLIMGEILKRKKNAGDYVALIKRKYKGAGGFVWVIVNKKDEDRGLMWKQDEKNWYSSNPSMKAPLSPVILNALIKRWVVDQMG